jgi:hypothetical protein
VSDRPIGERMRREVDPLGVRSAETPSWTGETVRQLVDECVRATRRRFTERESDTYLVVTAEVAAFMEGFVAGRGFDVDITDALLVALNMPADAV